jgi:hypothetical protein
MTKTYTISREALKSENFKSYELQKSGDKVKNKDFSLLASIIRQLNN